MFLPLDSAGLVKLLGLSKRKFVDLHDQCLHVSLNLLSKILSRVTELAFCRDLSTE